MNTQNLFAQLSEIRRAAISIIKDVMASISTTDINVCECENITTTPPLTHEGEEDYALASISLRPDGHLVFESDGEFVSLTEGEDDLPADVLLEIAKWMEENQKTFIEMGQDEIDDEELNCNKLAVDEIYITDGHGGWGTKKIDWR